MSVSGWSPSANETLGAFCSPPGACARAPENLALDERPVFLFERVELQEGMLDGQPRRIARIHAHQRIDRVIQKLLTQPPQNKLRDTLLTVRGDRRTNG